jgi:DNA-binding transcriptional LysR family regulator
MLTSWVRDGSLDFALALIAPGADIHDMETTPLFDSDVAVIARRGHPLARSRALADLQNAEWVSTRQRGGGAPANKLSALFEHAKLAPPRIAATTEAVFDTLHCLASSDYLGLEPASLTGHPFFREHVEIVPIAERAGRTPVCLLRRAGVPLTPAAQELATMAVSYARMLPTQRDA